MTSKCYTVDQLVVNSKRLLFFLVLCLFANPVPATLNARLAPMNQTDSVFQDRIQPILAAKCYSCHGPKVQESGYRLDVRETAINGGDHGTPAILRNNSNASPLYIYVSDKMADLAMPPKQSEKPRLTEKEVLIIRDWIENGAEWPDSANVAKADPLDWWSFKPMKPVTAPGHAVNPIDAFIASKLAEKGLSMSQPSDARTLARRLYFDLIGLPPSPEELDAFEKESKIESESALDRLIEKLLAMPQYGERWARHWLDIVHYGDTHGYDKDKPRSNAWPYRDYVIRAFNADKPYARFVEEQIAGDVLWPATRDGIEALGFIAAGPWDFIGHAEVSESKTDGKIARHLDRDDMVTNTLGSFCSVTVHCAQCHQHKFDPISQEDYYRLHAVFSALDRTDRKYFEDPEMQKRFMELERWKNEASGRLKQIEDPLKAIAGEEFNALTKRIESVAKVSNRNAIQGEEFGYHSAISHQQDDVKWVQIDLGEQPEIERVTLLPCYDDFNGIGSGFGFPLRFKIEVSDHAAFNENVIGFGGTRDQNVLADFKNPGLTPYTVADASGNRTVGRYVRVTATKLAPRNNDFIFALAELQVFSFKNENISLGKRVAALDSTESSPRWRKSNLTDGAFPKIASSEDRDKLIQQRETLLLENVDLETKLAREKWAGLLNDAEEALKKMPPAKLVYSGGVHSGSGTFVGTGATGGKPRPIHLLVRGQVTQPSIELGPGALRALTFRPSEFPIEENAPEGARRAALAHWITDPSNPLTWRSIVNRVWQFHFGRGFVDTPNDFGHNGALPSHPELLDWLSIEFRASGGSLKNLHRLMVKSAAYRQSSASNFAGESIDSGNALFWRQNRRRLEAEAIRDSVLWVSGKLDRSMGGPGWQDFVVEHPEHSPHYEYGLADPEDPKTWRRSIYRFIVRSQTQPWMTSLDCADPSMRVDKRNESLSAIQSLALLNNGFMLTQSKHFAERVALEANNLSDQVDFAYRLASGCSPGAIEREQLIEFARSHGMPYLCRLLYNLNAFTFVD